MDRKQQFSIWYVLLALLVLVSIQNMLGRHIEPLAYGDIKTLLDAGKLVNETISEDDIRKGIGTDGLNGLLPPEKLDALQRSSDERHDFVTIRVDDSSLTQALETFGVTFTEKRENPWLVSILSIVLWIAVFFGNWSYAIRHTPYAVCSALVQCCPLARGYPWLIHRLTYRRTNHRNMHVRGGV